MNIKLMNTMLFKRLSLVSVAVLISACGGRSNPIALEVVQNPIVDLITKLGDGPAAGPITLYSAVLAQGVPARVAQKAFSKYDEFSDVVRNPGYITMVDFTQHSGSARFYMVDRQTGKVDKLAVAHGTGSDPDNDGYAQLFSNVPDSRMSSLGAYLIQEKYLSAKFGDSMRLDGLEATNNKARERAIVLHPSHYVTDSRSKQGRSWGCPAIPYEWIQTVIARAQDGGFMYAYGINRRSTSDDLRLLQQWDLVPKALWTNESEDAPEFGE